MVDFLVLGDDTNVVVIVLNKFSQYPYGTDSVPEGYLGLWVGKVCVEGREVTSQLVPKRERVSFGKFQENSCRMYSAP
jgi:hypothetical protein